MGKLYGDFMRRYEGYSFPALVERKGMLDGLFKVFREERNQWVAQKKGIIRSSGGKEGLSASQRAYIAECDKTFKVRRDALGDEYGALKYYLDEKKSLYEHKLRKRG